MSTIENTTRGRTGYERRLDTAPPFRREMATSGPEPERSKKDGRYHRGTRRPRFSLWRTGGYQGVVWHRDHRTFPRGPNMRAIALATALIAISFSSAAAQPANMMELPPDVRAWFRNPDGSCVQCSIGMCGVFQNIPQATTLLWNTEYGPKVRGGSYPSRVAEYCRSRNIPAWNVTGNNTMEWMEWAAKTGRFAAIGAGRSHFQTLYGHDPSTQTWYVCNNNSTHRVDEYSHSAFRSLHNASGPWVVVLKYAAPAHPVYVNWWD